jgi:nitrogen fixation/metabolism regulation signal transduction histidine kinase
MAFNKFSLTVLFLVLLIAGTSFLMIWSFDKDYLVVAKFTFTLLWILEIAYLLYYVTKTNRSLNIFLEALKSSDFVKSKESDPSFKQLSLQSNEIINIVKDARIERESQYHYFQYTLELIPVGVISFDKETGTIDIFNKAAGELLNSKNPDHINDLEKLKPGLSEILNSMYPGRHQLLRMTDGFEEKKIVVNATEFYLFQRLIKVVSLQNIKQQLEEEELNAWQKLTSVLRHEIMNSVGPVRSLTRTLLRMLSSNGKVKKIEEITNKTLTDTVTGLESIENRTKGMISFVQSYRELTKIPKPHKKKINGAELISSVENLMKYELASKGAKLKTEVSTQNLVLEVDERQITQVLINLLKNASDAFSEKQTDRSITLKAYGTDVGSVCIEVSDNGMGIPENIREKVFIPFYTTKEEGSGVGLNFARQIMSLHGGHISLHSVEGEGSAFKLEFQIH